MFPNPVSITMHANLAMQYYFAKDLLKWSGCPVQLCFLHDYKDLQQQQLELKNINSAYT